MLESSCLTVPGVGVSPGPLQPRGAEQQPWVRLAGRPLSREGKGCLAEPAAPGSGRSTLAWFYRGPWQTRGRVLDMRLWTLLVDSARSILPVAPEADEAPAPAPLSLPLLEQQSWVGMGVSGQLLAGRGSEG